MSYASLKNDGKKVKCYVPHVCEWCGEAIQIGEEAISRNYVFEGDIQSTHQHPECFEAMRNSSEYFIFFNDEGFDAGEFNRGEAVNRYGEPVVE